MTEPAISVAFFDPAHDLHGSARAGVSLLFEGKRSTAIPEGPQLGRDGATWHASVADAFSVDLEPVADPVDLAGATTTLCRARGTAAGRAIDGLGTVTETHVPPSWEELDALRGLSAIFDAGHALFAVARRPRGARSHDADLIEAVLIEGGTARPAEEARLSTIYDGEGRQRGASFELWMPGEDFPRRAFGTVTGGTTLQLEHLRVNAAVFSWRMEGRTGAGAYDIVVRDLPPDAA